MSVDLPGTEILDKWTLWTLVENRAALGDKPMLTVDEGDTVSYAGLYDKSRRAGAALAAIGVAAGDFVASIGYNSTDQAVLLYGCAAIGAVWVPLNVSLVGNDLAYTLNDSNADVLVIDAELIPHLQAVEDRIQIGKVYVRGEHDVSRYESFAELLASASTSEFTPTPSQPEEGVAVIYTGGSTGMPKGVLASHTYFLAASLRYQDVAQARPDDVHYTGGLQLYHCGGQQFAVTGPMLVGISAHISRWGVSFNKMGVHGGRTV